MLSNRMLGGIGNSGIGGILEITVEFSSAFRSARLIRE